ncbi:MAG: 50S ribosomal protein L1 [Pseudomonadota bacterium]|jgi:large subunit ribosomal protein L1|nr:50S ribosomal protein L1 [Pseudomonadota bacterium]MED5555720.1 50S ribosomal protein L1 [Pseudomonadota bacterium]|tara:strand:- start:141 stop:836 length:696 start_codon:yes stop_codon:yes gene_type:complete
MAKMTRQRKIIEEKVDYERAYPIGEAVVLLNEISGSKFNESLDISVNLGIDPKKSDQTVRGATSLPHGSGKEIRVAVFAEGANADKAQEAGADIVGFEDLAEEIKKGELDFDVLIATPDSMRLVGQLGKVLGPRGLMPNPKTGTVTADVATAVSNAKSGQIQFRADRGGIVHGSVGKLGFDPLQIKENIEALISDLRKAKPASAKGVFLKKITLSSTMGPGLVIDEASIEA